MVNHMLNIQVISISVRYIFIHIILNYFVNLLEGDYLIRDEFLLAEDAAIVALSVLIKKYREYFENTDAIDKWYELLPIHEQNKRNDIVYNLLCDLIEERHEALFNDEDPLRLIQQISIVYLNLISDNVKQRIVILMFEIFKEFQKIYYPLFIKENFGDNQWRSLAYLIKDISNYSKINK